MHTDEAKINYDRGNKYPYDQPDDDDGNESLHPIDDGDWATRAARGVVCDLKDRRDIKHGFQNVDEETRAEIIESLAGIIRYAHEVG
jgi:hypothetical protein